MGYFLSLALALLSANILCLSYAWDFPSNITLRGGVLHAPPFATVEEQPDGSFIYGGFQIDLLDRMATFAKQDNVTLNVLLSPSPPQYGPALDLVANDCNTSVNVNTFEDCNRFDFIVGNYYATPARGLRVALSPAWLRSTITTIKYLDKTGQDFTTLSQAEDAKASVCLKDGTFYAGVVRAKFPNAEYFGCPGTEGCIAALKNEDCVLYASDELQLRYVAAWDPSTEVTREQFNTQYIVWPFSYELPVEVRLLMDKWIRDAITNATMDELYFKYFQKALCPVGTAGENCQLPCDPDHGQADARGVCVCESTKWTGDDCSEEVPEELNLLPTYSVVVAYTMFMINVVTILGCAGWLFWKRNAPEVKVSQPFFLCLVLFGCLISSSTILALAQEDEADGSVPACMAIPWLYSVGFSVTFGTLFAKIRRVYMIFKNASNPNPESRRHIISVKETLALIGAVLFVDIVILIVWTVVDPLQWERVVISEDQFGVPLESEGKCVSEHWGVFAGLIAMLHFALMGVACYLCYVSRDIPTRFSEGKYVSIAMISNLQIFVVGIPILIIIGTEPETSFFVRSVIIWMNDFVVVTLIFGNLIKNVHFRDPNDNDVKALVGNTVQRYSSQAPRGDGGIKSIRTPTQSYLSTTPLAPRNGANDDESSGLGESNKPERNPADDKPSDFLSKDSWAGVNLSLYVGSDGGHRQISQSRLTASDFEDEVEEGDDELGESEANDSVRPMKSFASSVTKPVDVLGDKTSWGGGTLSMIMKDDSNSRHDDELLAPSDHQQAQDNHAQPTPVTRDDVLEGKSSWGRGCLSSVVFESTDHNEESAHNDEQITETQTTTPPNLNPRVSYHANDELSV